DGFSPPRRQAVSTPAASRLHFDGNEAFYHQTTELAALQTRIGLEICAGTTLEWYPEEDGSAEGRTETMLNRSTFLPRAWSSGYDVCLTRRRSRVRSLSLLRVPPCVVSTARPRLVELANLSHGT